MSVGMVFYKNHLVNSGEGKKILLIPIMSEIIEDKKIICKKKNNTKMYLQGAIY